SARCWASCCGARRDDRRAGRRMVMSWEGQGGEPPTSGAPTSGAPTDADTPTVARRQRRLALPTGILLAVCLFLPTVRVCGSPTYPITVPPFWTPYLLGIGVAILGGARTLRGLRVGLIFVDVVMGLSVGGWGVAALFGG